MSFTQSHDNLTSYIIDPYEQMKTPAPTQPVTEYGVPQIIKKSFTGTALSTAIFATDAPFKFQILDYHVRIDTAGTSATTLKLTDGTNDITDALDIHNTGSVGANDIVRGLQIDATHATIDVGGSLNIVISDATDSPAGEVIILACKVA